MLNNEHEKAVDLFNKFITLHGNCDNFLLLFLLGRHYYQREMYAIAISLFSKSTKIFPCKLTFNELAKTHEKLNNFDMAEKYFQLAVNYNNASSSSSSSSTFVGLKNLLNLYEKQNRICAAKLCENFLN